MYSYIYKAETRIFILITRSSLFSKYNELDNELNYITILIYPYFLY